MILTNDEAIDLVGRPFQGTLDRGVVTGLRTALTSDGEVVDGVTVTYPDGTYELVDLDEMDDDGEED